MAGMWDWLPGPSGLWNYLSQTPGAEKVREWVDPDWYRDYLSQYPERYRNQILQGLMDWAETTRGGSPVGTSAHLLSALNPVRPLASDALLKVGEDVADKANRYQQWAIAKAERTGLPVPDYNEMTAQQGAFIPSLALSATGWGRTGGSDDAVRAFIRQTKAHPRRVQPGQQVATRTKEPGVKAEGGLIQALEQAPALATREAATGQALSMWPDDTQTPPLLESREALLKKGFLYSGEPGEVVTPSASLTSDEKKLLKSDEYGLSREQRNTVSKAILDYRKTHHPDQGWQPYSVQKLIKTETSKGDVYKPVISAKNAGFDFHRDPDTGLELTGTDRQKKVSSMGGAMANEVATIMNRPDHNAQIIKQAFEWYQKVENRLRTDYGSVADIYGDLLAALSPDTRLSTNFKFAEEALGRFASGAFDKQLEFMDKWLADGNSLDKLPDQYIIRQANGKKYGKNGRNAMLAMLGKFRDVSPGTGPKMRRYGGNVVGTSYDTTVDVWNARTNQRLAGQLDQRHKRVIPKLNAVEGMWVGSGLGAKPRVGLMGEGDQPFAIWKGKQSEGLPIKISGAYGFASDVTDDALFKLREMGYDIKGARDLQAFEWLNEKNIWEGEGWTPKDDSANLVELLADVERYRGGVSPTQQTTPTLEDFLAIQGTLTQGLNEDPMVLAATAPTSAGYYFGEPELSSDSQVVAREGWDPLPYYQNVIQAGLDHNQSDVFVSKVMPDGEGLNSRPGVEIMFDPDKIRDAMPVLKKLLKDQPGYTIIPSNRFVQEGDRAKVSGVGGFYIQWVPEIDIRFDDDLRAKLKANPDLIYEIKQQKENELADLAEKAEKIASIVSSKPFWYNTEVFGKTADGGFDDGGYTGRTTTGDPIAGAADQAIGRQRQQITLLTELARALKRIEGWNF